MDFDVVNTKKDIMELATKIFDSCKFDARDAEGVQMPVANLTTILEIYNTLNQVFGLVKAPPQVPQAPHEGTQQPAPPVVH